MQPFSLVLELYKVMVKCQGSLCNQAVLSPVGMEVYLLQILVGRNGESIGRILAMSMRAASKKRYDSVLLEY